MRKKHLHLPHSNNTYFYLSVQIAFKRKCQAGFPEKITDDEECYGRREPLRHMYPESSRHHHQAEKKDRVHGAVLEKHIFLHPFDIGYRQLPHHHRSDTVAEEDKRHRKREGERPEQDRKS